MNEISKFNIILPKQKNEKNEKKLELSMKHFKLVGKKDLLIEIHKKHIHIDKIKFYCWNGCSFNQFLTFNISTIYM